MKKMDFKKYVLLILERKERWARRGGGNEWGERNIDVKLKHLLIVSCMHQNQIHSQPGYVP